MLVQVAFRDSRAPKLCTDQGKYKTEGAARAYAFIDVDVGTLAPKLCTNQGKYNTEGAARAYAIMDVHVDTIYVYVPSFCIKSYN